MPAMAAVQARDRQSSIGSSSRPRSYQSSARAASKVIRASRPSVGPPQVGGHPEALPVLGGQVRPGPSRRGPPRCRGGCW